MVTSPYGTMLLVANPGAGRGRNAVLPRLEEALRRRGLAFETAVTDAPGDAARLAREAVEDRDLRFLVAVGGDGTVHEVVNGLVDAATGAPRASDVVLGAVAGGSGCDFIRTFGLDRAPERMVAHLDGEGRMPIDLGRARLTGPDGRPRTVLFANVAEAGYGALVVERAAAMPRWVGRARYLLGILSAVRRFELVDATVTVDHTSVAEPMSNVIVANGQFFGGNLKVAPRALPDDGRLNVQIWRGEARDVFLQTPKLRVGEHLSSPDVREYQSTTVRVDARRPIVVEADGEVLGTTPATFDVLGHALHLKV